MLAQVKSHYWVLYVLKQEFFARQCHVSHLSTGDSTLEDGVQQKSRVLLGRLFGSMGCAKGNWSVSWRTGLCVLQITSYLWTGILPLLGRRLCSVTCSSSCSQVFFNSSFSWLASQMLSFSESRSVFKTVL